MLRLTRLTDYGILLMAEMAVDDGRLCTAAEMSELTHIPAPTVSKVLQALLATGLLESIRGARGGYRLARTANQISLREIINALEGHIALTECNLDHTDCEQMPYCSTHGNWKRINEAIRDVLENISLADMTTPGFMPLFRMERVIPVRSVSGVHP